MPKSIRHNAIVGFTNMLTGRYGQEHPDAVLVAWDTLEVPTYRHEAFEPYQSGRVFDPSLLDQLALLPQLCEAFGFAIGKAAGYEAEHASSKRSARARSASETLREVPAQQRACGARGSRAE